MAIIGLSKPYFGDYSNSSGTVTYYNGFVGGKAVNYSLDVELTDDNPLYADNEIAENDLGSFKQATLKLSTDDLTNTVSKKLLGLKTVTRSASSSSSTYSETVFDDSRTEPVLGFGVIEEHKVNGSLVFRTLVLPKVIAKIPSDAATTKGDQVDWQTPEIEFVAYRSDEVSSDTSTGYNHPWKIVCDHTSETDAENYLKLVLGYGVTPPAAG